MRIPASLRPLVAGMALASTVALLAGAATASAHQQARDTGSGLAARVLVNGANLSHQTPNGAEALSNPDDITYADGHIFVAFQNGVGPQGQASPTGNLDSTIVEFTVGGQEVTQWDIVGKCDGLTADRDANQLIATVNEDANSSVYVIDNPGPAATAVQYQYSRPLPSDGGTDAIEIYQGQVLISASAPGTTGAGAPQATYPAVYRVSFDAATKIAHIEALYGDEAPAVVANTNASNFGATVNLALTDPDSNEVVPSYAPRFAGDFMLASQGDEEQIFYSGRNQPLSVLKLTASVDDTAWPSTSDGVLYTTDNGNDVVIAITGKFAVGYPIAAVTPCDENSAPATCPAPDYPPNYLGQINPWTGKITRIDVSGPAFEPQGMMFLPRSYGL